MKPDSMVMYPVFNSVNCEVEANSVFVLMPFQEAWSDDVYYIINAVGEEAGFKIKRADNIFKPGIIINDIWESIKRAEIIIADITVHNANVFYELGIAHAFGKEVILIRQKDIADVPFDIRHWRYIEYGITPKAVNVFKEDLVKALKSESGKASASVVKPAKAAIRDNVDLMEALIKKGIIGVCDRRGFPYSIYELTKDYYTNIFIDYKSLTDADCMDDVIELWELKTRDDRIKVLDPRFIYNPYTEDIKEELDFVRNVIHRVRAETCNLSDMKDCNVIVGTLSPNIADNIKNNKMLKNAKRLHILFGPNETILKKSLGYEDNIKPLLTLDDLFKVKADYRGRLVK